MQISLTTKSADWWKQQKHVHLERRSPETVSEKKLTQETGRSFYGEYSLFRHHTWKSEERKPWYKWSCVKCSILTYELEVSANKTQQPFSIAANSLGIKKETSAYP